LPRGRRQLGKCVWDCFAKYYGVDQSKRGKPGRAYRKHDIRIAYKILVGIPDGKKSVAYRSTDNIKICICEVTCVGVVWIYLTHAAQLQAVLKMTTNGGCVLQNQLLAFQGGGGGGVTLDLEVTNGYGVLCSGRRAQTVVYSDHIPYTSEHLTAFCHNQIQ